MTQEEFLLSTIEYYSADTNRRNKTPYVCCYFPLKPNSEGCAIGRWLKPELAKELDSMGYTAVKRQEVFNRLPIKLKKLTSSFLQDIQELHDYDSYWEESGLSKEGIEKVNQIIKNYKLNIPLYA